MVLDGGGGLAVLTAPLVLLLVVIAHAEWTERRRRRRAKLPPVASTGRYGLAPAQQRSPRTAVPGEVRGEPELQPSTEADARSTTALQAAIAKADASRDEPRLAALHLEIAVRHRAEGAGATAAQHLRTAIRIAARLGIKDIHAAARLEIGDLAREGGDLTTACEHWQIARGLYFEAGAEAQLAEAEQRMRGNGCPTDWVLNDF